MKNGVHLQGFKGYFEGTKAIDIKVGDVYRRFNYDYWK